MAVISVIIGSMFLWSTLVVFAGLFVGLWRCRKTRAGNASASRDLRFACVICAHNEEKVISRPVLSLLDSDYPRDRFEVVVFADNCADRTAEIAKSFPGVKVYEKRTPSTGKGDVLAWGLDIIRHDGYDAIAVFDADNEIDRRWLKVMNGRFAGGADVVTGHRMVSNPFVNLITGWYTIYWNLMNELSNRVRSNLGLSAMLTGTGFVFRTEVLPEEGWRTVTFVEDLEFAITVNFAGYRVEYASDAVFYDEQPVSIRPMVRQLNRWATGGLQILVRYPGRWLKALAAQPSFRVFDCFAVVTLGLSGCATLIFNLATMNWWFIPGFVVLGWTSAVLSTSLSRYAIRTLFWPVFTFPLFALVLSYTVAFSVFFPQRKWKPIAHGN
jgi:cellulose synthase/poly-beta-1,6-N-acetylglucosamine synthase-like glycosyltransferase